MAVEENLRMDSPLSVLQEPQSPDPQSHDVNLSELLNAQSMEISMISAMPAYKRDKSYEQPSIILKQFKSVGSLGVKKLNVKSSKPPVMRLKIKT